MSDLSVARGSLVPDELAEALAEAESFLEQLGGALFPSGAPSWEQMTWEDTRDASSPGGASLEDRVKQAEARFRTLVEQIPAVTFMAVLGEGENEIYVSPHIEQLLGFSQSEWLGNPFLWYYQLHPDDRPLWNEEFARGCRTGGPFRAECRFLSRDGKVVWVHGEARIVKDDQGRPQFLQGVAFDITETKRAQQVLLEQAVRAARAEEGVAIAHRMQTSILPSDREVEGLDIASTMLPAEQVGGDYYDIQSAEGGLWLSIGDVSGHGLNAGLVMLMVQSANAALTRAHSEATPRAVVLRLNEVVFENVAQRLGDNEYVTFTLFRYWRDGRVVYSGAHEYVLLCRHETGKIERLPSPGTWLGLQRDIELATVEATFQLYPGDLWILYSDGLIEAMNEHGEQFDMGRLGAAIEEVQDRSPAQIRDHVLNRMRQWCPVPDDDVTLVVCRYKGAT